MSHFTVAVIHHPHQSVDDLLEPFDETLPKEFEDLTESLKEEYEQATVRRYQYPNGTLKEYEDVRRECVLLVSSEQWQDPELSQSLKEQHLDYTIRNIQGTSYRALVMPELFGVKEVQIPAKECMTFEEYALDYCGYREENGKYGYFYNPDAKWDWYSIGGRWNGMLRLKDGATGEKGEDGVFGGYDDDGFSSAKVGDIDFSMNEELYEEAKRWWEVVMEDAPLRDDEDASDFQTFYRKEYLQERYGDKETYAKSTASFSTWAILTPNGEWHETGTMGWFGMSDASTERQKTWEEQYMDFINAANPEDIFTLVDCHI